jgi:hypothetical protein
LNASPRSVPSGDSKNRSTNFHAENGFVPDYFRSARSREEYINLKSLEIKNLKILFLGKINNIAADEMKERSANGFYKNSRRRHARHDPAVQSDRSGRVRRLDSTRLSRQLKVSIRSRLRDVYLEEIFDDGLTEELKELGERFRGLSITAIAGAKGSSGKSLERIRANVKRAIGIDIFADKGGN